jgi:thiosulfate dehydrogenase
MRPREAKVKNFVGGIVATLIVFTFGGWLYLRLGYADLRANLPPSRLESELATSAVNASAARHAPSRPNPIAPTEANLLDGARLYRDKCADCHGRPDNPASDYGSSFNPRAPQFIQAHPSLAENQDFYIIKNGVRRSAMPAWGNVMADSEIWQVVTFLHHLDNLPPSVQQSLHRPAGSG